MSRLSWIVVAGGLGAVAWPQLAHGECKTTRVPTKETRQDAEDDVAKAQRDVEKTMSRQDAEDSVAKAQRDVENKEVQLAKAKRALQVEVDRLADEGGDITRAQAFTEAQAELDEARQKLLCLEENRNAVERNSVYVYAISVYASGALGAGVVPNRLGGGASFHWRAGVGTELELGLSAHRLVERVPPNLTVDANTDTISNTALLGLPFRIYFDRIASSGVSPAFFLGSAIELLTRSGSTPVALSAQVGARFLTRFPATDVDKSVGGFTQIRVFAEPRIFAFDSSARAPISVLFGLEIGGAVTFKGKKVDGRQWVSAGDEHAEGKSSSSTPDKK